MKNRFVAKCSVNLGKLFDYELSPRFEDCRDCLEFIHSDKSCCLIEHYLTQAFYELNSFYYKDGVKHRQFHLNLGSWVRVYDLDDKRFCDCFDF